MGVQHCNEIPRRILAHWPLQPGKCSAASDAPPSFIRISVGA